MLRRFIPLLVPLAVVLGVFGIGGVAIALTLEDQDAFCAACHTQPEVTFYQRSTGVAANDLASFHAQKQTRCIDCHSGTGVNGRVQALEQGQVDLFAFLGGSYAHPAVLTNPLPDASCIKCHPSILDRAAKSAGRVNSHYHYFLPRWQQAAPNAAHCTTCHTGHTVGDNRLDFADGSTVTRICNECHSVLRK